MHKSQSVSNRKKKREGTIIIFMGLKNFLVLIDNLTFAKIKKKGISGIENMSTYSLVIAYRIPLSA